LANTAAPDTASSGPDLSSLSNSQLLALNNNMSASNGNVYTAAINHIESHGATDTANPVNPDSGASSSMQTMKDTSRDPGYGVKPSDGTPSDNARMGRDYYNALNAHFGDPTIAAVAYDWGPGRTQKWLDSGGDLSKLPDETLNYINQFHNNVQAMGGVPTTSTQPTTQTAQPTNVAMRGSGSPFSAPTDFQKQFPGNLPSDTGSGNPITATAAGMGEGLGKSMLGLQSLAGKGLEGLGATDTGQWLQSDAAKGAKNLTAQSQEVGGSGTARAIGNVIGGTAPYLLAPIELGPQAIAGAIGNAGQASLEGKPILPAAVEGGGMGAGGVVGGRALEAGAAALKPAVTKLIGAAKGGEDAAVAGIAKQVGDVNGTVADLRAGADSGVSGVQPTAAEAAPAPSIISMQRAMQNTAAGQQAFPARIAENTEARLNAAQDVVGSDIRGEAQQFNAHQDNLTTQGVGEVGPMSEADAAMHSSPAFNEAVTDAKKSADNAGLSHFSDVADANHAQIANDIDQFAGTADDLNAARQARQVQANKDYGEVGGFVPITDPALRDLAARPEFQQAFRDAASLDASRAGSAAEPAVARGQGPSGQWVPKQINIGTLQGTKALLEDKVGTLTRAGAFNEANAVRNTKDALDTYLKNNSSAYTTANANFAAASAPIDRMHALQSRLIGAVNPVTGEVSPNALKNAIISIQKEQFKPGLRPADKVSDADLNTLAALSQRANVASKNMTGLSGQGQEMIRQALEAKASKSADAAAARDAFNQYLANKSPAYTEKFRNAAGYGQDIAQRQQLQQAIDSLRTAAYGAGGVPNLTHPAVKSVLNKIDAVPGSSTDLLKTSLLADMQKSTTANAKLGAAGSDTAANLNLGGGLIGKMLGHKFGEGAAHASLAHGNIPAAAASYIGGKILNSASVKTEAAAIDLLLNPKKLADKLEAYANQPKTKQQFINALKQKASGGGKAGVAAVQAYNSRQSN
jgi:Transglycosylase SLT domain